MAEGFVAGIDYAAFKEDTLRLYASPTTLKSFRKHRAVCQINERHGIPPSGGGKWRQREISTVMNTKMSVHSVWYTLTVSLKLLKDVVTLELSAMDGSPYAPDEAHTESPDYSGFAHAEDSLQTLDEWLDKPDASRASTSATCETQSAYDAWQAGAQSVACKITESTLETPALVERIRHIAGLL